MWIYKISDFCLTPQRKRKHSATCINRIALCVAILNKTGVFTIWSATFDVMVKWINCSIYVQIYSWNENNSFRNGSFSWFDFGWIDSIHNSFLPRTRYKKTTTAMSEPSFSGSDIMNTLATINTIKLKNSAIVVLISQGRTSKWFRLNEKWKTLS